MVKPENIIKDDGVKRIRYYSDKGYKIIQKETGIIYEEAIDFEDAGYTYDETNELINNIEIDTTINPSNM